MLDVRPCVVRESLPRAGRATPGPCAAPLLRLLGDGEAEPFLVLMYGPQGGRVSPVCVPVTSAPVCRGWHVAVPVDAEAPW